MLIVKKISHLFNIYLLILQVILSFGYISKFLKRLSINESQFGCGDLLLVTMLHDWMIAFCYSIEQFCPKTVIRNGVIDT